jgi:hypothetical protein
VILSTRTLVKDYQNLRKKSHLWLDHDRATTVGGADSTLLIFVFRLQDCQLNLATIALEKRGRDMGCIGTHTLPQEVRNVRVAESSKCSSDFMWRSSSDKLWFYE